MEAAGFLSGYLCGPSPYVQRHITVNHILNASLNETFLPSFDSDKYLPMTSTMGSLGVAVLLTTLQEDAMSCDSSPEVAVRIRAIYFIVKYVQLYFYYYISLMHHLHVFL